MIVIVQIFIVMIKIMLYVQHGKLDVYNTVTIMHIQQNENKMLYMENSTTLDEWFLVALYAPE